VSYSKASCQTITEWGRCKQRPRHDSQWCSYHYAASQIADFRHDSYYHRKIAVGLLNSSHEILTKTEIDALFKGRTRNDGRRTDLYTIL